MDISITIEAMFGLNWPLWKTLVARLEHIGFTSIFRSDHFMIGPQPVKDSLELITSLTYLADHTQRVKFGSLVAPLSFRDPVMLARQAMALNDLSGGRMILGVGAGWMEEEHRVFGYPLGDIKTRMDRFSEGLEMITRLIRENQPVTFAGRYYQLEQAQLHPQSRTQVLIGGKGQKRTLPLVAQYADIWNCPAASVETFQSLSAELDSRLLALGRQPDEVKRTVMIPVFCWRTEADVNRFLNHLNAAAPLFSFNSPAALFSFLDSRNGLYGTAETVIAKIRAYFEAGVDEFIIQWASLTDIDSLEVIAEKVLPEITKLPVR